MKEDIQLTPEEATKLLQILNGGGLSVRLDTNNVDNTLKEVELFKTLIAKLKRITEQG